MPSVRKLGLAALLIGLAAVLLLATRGSWSQAGCGAPPAGAVADAGRRVTDGGVGQPGRARSPRRRPHWGPAAVALSSGRVHEDRGTPHGALAGRVLSGASGE